MSMAMNTSITSALGDRLSSVMLIRIIQAIRTAAEDGTSFGIPNPLEVRMAKLIRQAVPSVQGSDVQFGNGSLHVCDPSGPWVHQAR